MRAVDARRFVREFKKEYGDQIEDARKVKTEGDALDALLGWMDGARPSQLSAKDGCWRFTGNEPEWFRKWILLRVGRKEIGDCSQMTIATIIDAAIDGSKTKETYGEQG